jgi:hypothetical protein
LSKIFALLSDQCKIRPYAGQNLLAREALVLDEIREHEHHAVNDVGCAPPSLPVLMIVGRKSWNVDHPDLGILCAWNW